VISVTTTGQVSRVNTPPAENVAVGSATVDGTAYHNIAFAGMFDLTGPTVTLPLVPPLDPADLPFPARFSGPFSFTGTLSGFRVLDVRDPQQLFTASVSGTGTVEALFLGGPDQRYSVDRLDYEFAPTPEPGTLLLVGGATVAGFARRRRQTTAH
jgi:hypothetical protein